MKANSRASKRVLMICVCMVVLVFTVVVVRLSKKETFQRINVAGVYVVDISSHRKISGSDQRLQSEISFDLDVSFRELNSDGRSLELRIVNSRSAACTLMGVNILDGPDKVQQLVGNVAIGTYGPDGQIDHISLQPNASVDFESIAHLIFSQIQFPEKVQSDGAWTELQHAWLGAADVTYTGSSGELTRTTGKYHSLTGTTSSINNQVGAGLAKIRSADNGHLEVLDYSETFNFELANAGNQISVAADIRSLIRYKGASPESAPARLADFGRTAPIGEPLPRESGIESALKNRIDGMTIEQAKQDILVLGNSSMFQNHTKWLWQVTGLLTRDPAACSNLGAVFLDTSTTPRGRRLVLDLLASTGSPQAQTVIRELLDSGIARESDERTDLYQRLSLIDHPTQETLDFASAHFRSAPVSDNAAEEYALGAVAGNTYQSGEKDRAIQAMEPVQRSLRQNNSPEQVVADLASLGNAGVGEFSSAILDQTTSENPKIRAAAADALRKITTPAAHDALFIMMNDSEESVRSSAIEALSSQGLTSGMAARLVSAIESSRVPASNYEELLGWITTKGAPKNNLTVLNAILKSAPPGSRAAFRAASLIGQMQGVSGGLN